MAKKKMTPWFPADVKPARKGWYQRDYAFVQSDMAELPDYWDGTQWLVGVGTNTPRELSFDQHKQWRGLAEKPCK